MFPGAKANFFGVPAFQATIASVHFINIAREQGRFVSARAGADFDNHAVVGFTRRKEERFDFID